MPTNFNSLTINELVEVKNMHLTGQTCLRGEVKFESVQGLIQQLQADQAASQAYFQQINKEG